MNQTQRKFIIERIQKRVKVHIAALKAGKLKYPSPSNFIFREILNGKLKLQSEEAIMGVLKKKALKAKEGENWLSSRGNSWSTETKVDMDIKDLIVVPADYKKEYDMVVKHNKEIDQEIGVLELQLDSIEVRVQLASDSKLKKLINDVDDMGDIRLVDATLKLNE